MDEDKSFMDKARQMFKDELLRRLALSGTLDATEGTIKPLLTYPAEDPVNIWYQKNRSEDKTDKKWDAEADCEYLNQAMEGAGQSQMSTANSSYISVYNTCTLLLTEKYVDAI